MHGRRTVPRSTHNIIHLNSLNSDEQNKTFKSDERKMHSSSWWVYRLLHFTKLYKGCQQNIQQKSRSMEEAHYKITISKNKNKLTIS